MSTLNPLSAEALRWRCNPAELDFETTDDLTDDVDIVGQPRASEAMRFGVGIRQDGFNVFALGPAGAGKRFLVKHVLDGNAAEQPVPDDTCYVHNFGEPHASRVLRVPAGVGSRLRDDMEGLVEDLRASLMRALESEEYASRRRVLEHKYEEEPETAFEALREEAKSRHLALLRTPAGFAFAPTGDDEEVLAPDAFKALPEEEREQLAADIEEMQAEVQNILRRVPGWQRERNAEMRKLNREAAGQAVEHLIDALRSSYDELTSVQSFLDDVQSDILEHANELMQSGSGTDGHGNVESSASGSTVEPTFMRRYLVNVIVDHAQSEHAPVVYEENPTHANLVGRVEHIAQMGALVTDFNLIRAGALHRANGGYLVLDARSMLTQHLAWDALKRTLRTGQLRIESLGEALSLVSTVTLDPEPVPIDVKVVLLGEPLLYYLLCAYDPDFPELFKVAADFDDRIERTPDNLALYARLLASMVRRASLRPFDHTAVARVIEYGARRAGDAERLSIHAQGIADLLSEADYWAGESGHDTVDVGDVQRAVDAAVYRSDRMRQRSHESILRDTVFVDTDGAQVGQVNGLAVLQLGQFAFARPSRITARVRLGKGEVIDIEREVDLSGPIHAKGVLILSGFLGARYAPERPLSLSASLVFEQSYGGIEGDSASSAELYALLSAISEVPLKQSLAVTGSVNQHGQIQPIGAVNEKIEGFFDICRARGLTGEQGVLIPSANVKHLMLRSDVVAAVEEGQFHVYAVATVDEGIELLTGLAAGDRGANGEYEEGTVNARVEARLADLADKRRALGTPADDTQANA